MFSVKTCWLLTLAKCVIRIFTTIKSKFLNHFYKPRKYQQHSGRKNKNKSCWDSSPCSDAKSFKLNDRDIFVADMQFSFVNGLLGPIFFNILTASCSTLTLLMLIFTFSCICLPFWRETSDGQVPQTEKSKAQIM